MLRMKLATLVAIGTFALSPGVADATHITASD
jgi:hypothetical protein